MINPMAGNRRDMIVAIVLVLLPLLTAADESAPRQPIIDMHLHAFDPIEYGPILPRNPVTGKSAPKGSHDAIWDATLAEMKRFNIVTGVASGPLKTTLRWQKKGNGRIIGGAYLGRLETFPTVDEIEKEIRAGRIQVLGELALQYMGIAPGDSSIEPYLELAEKYDIPVGFHTGLGPPRITYLGAPDFEIGMGDPKLLEPILKKHPKLRVYIMHGGWPYLESTKAIMYVYPQVYADLSVINWVIPQEEFYDYFEALITAGLGERLMYGSDQQLWPDAIAPSIRSIEEAPFLTEEQKRDIFYNNAKRFLRLRD